MPVDELVIDDLETLKVLADPLRLRIRELMTEPTTVKQVAEALGIPPTKLYYHINLLEKHNLIVVVDTRIVSGIIEKHYQIAARSVRVARHLLSPDSKEGDASLHLTIGSIFEDTKNDLLQSINDGTAQLQEAAAPNGAQLHTSRLLLNEDEAQEFTRRANELIEEYKQTSRAHQQHKDTGSPRYYKMLLGFFPTSRQQSKK
ncbi:helix-turn-helix transcriptional regulator [bacterium]|nr:helix-turn-helix transcriptional regulator [bacterium]